MSEHDPAEEIATLRALLAAEHAKAEGFAHLSHELRNLLSGVIGITGLLLETELTGEQRDYVKRVRGLGDALSGLVNNVLDFSKLEAGKFELERADLDPRRIVDEVGELLAERAQGKGLELVASVAGDVPTGLRGDAARLRQVLINLVGNALKFTDRGEVVIRASLVQATSEEVRVLFEVRDTGVGISREGQARLFQPFSQVHEGPSRAYGGTGLGLALSRQIVSALGGTIGVDSVTGKGSRFHFTAVLERRAPATERFAIPRVDMAGHRVLCAAGNASSRECLREMIVALGVECDEVANGADAFTVLRKAARDRLPYNVAMLDLSLPGALDLFRAIDTDELLLGLPVVLMAYPGQRLDEDERGEGSHPRPGTGPSTAGRNTPRGAIRVVTHLAKPVRQSQLHACLRTLMGSTVEQVAPESRRSSPFSAHGTHGTHGTRPRSATFSATTPAVTAPPVAVAAAPAPTPVSDRPVILLVEDNELNQRVGKLMVEKRGFRVEVASDGREAVEATLRHAYAAVLMDCQMPRFDGFSATAEIRARDAGKQPRLPIIAMTANAGPGAREQCLAAGMDDYVSKPVTPEALDDVLRRWVPRAGPAPIDEGPPARRPSSPVIDLSMLQKLRATQGAGESDIVTDVIALFLAESPPRLETLRAAVAKGDLATAARAAHTLKGSAGHLGAKTLAARCSRLEEKVRAGAPFNVAILVAAIEEELARVHAALTAEQRQRTSR